MRKQEPKCLKEQGSRRYSKSNRFRLRLSFGSHQELNSIKQLKKISKWLPRPCWFEVTSHNWPSYLTANHLIWGKLMDCKYGYSTDSKRCKTWIYLRIALMKTLELTRAFRNCQDESQHVQRDQDQILVSSCSSNQRIDIKLSFLFFLPMESPRIVHLHFEAAFKSHLGFQA